MTGVTTATVRRNTFIEAAETGGIAVDAANPQLLATLGGKMVQGRFLEAASERYPLVVLGAVAARRLGVDQLTVAGRPVQVYLGGTWFTVAGIIGPLPLAPEIERAALIGYPIARSAVRDDPSRQHAVRAGQPRTGPRSLLAAGRHRLPPEPRTDPGQPPLERAAGAGRRAEHAHLGVPRPRRGRPARRAAWGSPT